MEEFLPPHLMGPLQFSGALAGTLPQNTDTPGIPDYSRELSGNIKIKLVNGTLPELGVLKDFLTLLNIWNAYHDEWDALRSENNLRKFCKAHFLSFVRMREWRDIHRQLAGSLLDA